MKILKKFIKKLNSGFTVESVGKWREKTNQYNFLFHKKLFVKKYLIFFFYKEKNREKEMFYVKKYSVKRRVNIENLI